MIQIISGSKGKGKTKYLLPMVNECIKKAHGTVAYIDKNNKHMYELSNKIRLIDMSEYPIDNYDAFIGFIYGIICQDHDLEAMFLDSFLTISNVDTDYIEYVLLKLDSISNKYNVNFIISISVDESEMPKAFRDRIIVSL